MYKEYQNNEEPRCFRKDVINTIKNFPMDSSDLFKCLCYFCNLFLSAFFCLRVLCSR